LKPTAPPPTLPLSVLETTPAEVPPDPPSLERSAAACAVLEGPKPCEHRQRPKPQDEEEELPRVIDPLGAGALLLGCVALWFAAVPSLCGFVVPLSGVALLAGLTALVRAHRSGRSQRTFPCAGVVAAAAVMFAALGSPGLLGPTYQRFASQRGTDPTAIRRIALPGRAAGTGAEDPDWADAQRTALQQGQVTVQVEEVAVTSTRIALAPNQKGKGDVCLVIRLRVRQLPQGGMAAKPRGDVASLKDRYRPTLADATGRVYELLDVQTDGAAVGTRGVSALGLSDRVLVFEAPAGGGQALRLVVPAAAWGGSDAFRFAIPRAMIGRTAGGS
jgi:hypothetical protein